MALAIPNELTKLLAGGDRLAPLRACWLIAMYQVGEGMRLAGIGMAVVVVDRYAKSISICLEANDSGVAREVALLDQVIVLTAPAGSQEYILWKQQVLPEMQAFRIEIVSQVRGCLGREQHGFAVPVAEEISSGVPSNMRSLAFEPVVQ